MKFRTLIGGKLAGLRDYLMAEDLVVPKGLRGGTPVQMEGWPPIVDAKFYVMPRWLRAWLVVAPFVVVAALAAAVYHVERRLGVVSVQIEQLKR